jgi:hypothetical protein
LSRKEFEKTIKGVFSIDKIMSYVIYKHNAFSKEARRKNYPKEAGMERIEEKPQFPEQITQIFNKIKHRLARGVVIAGISYFVMMIILLATNRTNVGADVLLLWILVPDIYLSIFVAALAEFSWSVATHFARKALLEEKKQPIKEEGV